MSLKPIIQLGHLVRISVGLDTSMGFVWYPVWQAEVEATRHGKSRIFSPPLTPFPCKTDSIRLDMDCTKAKSWVEIDSVLFRGIDLFEWTPEFHKYYPVSFKKAIKTLLCINTQKSFWTRESVMVIIKYASMDWPLLEIDVPGNTLKKPAVTIDMAVVESLTSLGFNQEESIAALTVSGYNLEVALELLLASKTDE